MQLNINCEISQPPKKKKEFLILLRIYINREKLRKIYFIVFGRGIFYE